jgi:hypothetical protein
MLKPQPILLIIYDLINYLERSDENRKWGVGFGEWDDEDRIANIEL